jgi:hypothetical protein
MLCRNSVLAGAIVPVDTPGMVDVGGGDAGFAGIADSLAIDIRLVRVRDAWAVVLRSDHSVVCPGRCSSTTATGDLRLFTKRLGERDVPPRTSILTLAFGRDTRDNHDDAA